MRIAVLGAGAMGGAAARLIARHDVDLLVLDADLARARAVVALCGKGEARTIDGPLPEAIAGVEALAACVPYRLNLQVMEAALEARVPYADLGGLFHTTLRQLELDASFHSAGVPAVLGIGMAPGITNLLARLATERLDTVRSLDLVNGSVDARDTFGVPYSADTILDELTMPAMVFEEGALREVPPGSGAIPWTFPEPIGRLEAVYTLHSELATLPGSIEGVRDVRWRLALPPAVLQGFRTIVDLGLAGEEPVEVEGVRVAPRAVLRAALARIPPPEGLPQDAEATEVRAEGTRAGGPAVWSGRVICAPTPEGISAGAFGTALPIAIAARWLAEGRVEPGVHPPEEALPPEPFLTELAREGLTVDLD